MLRKRETYAAPSVLGVVQARLEGDLLAASVVDDVNSVTTAGQNVNGVYDAGSNDFEHKWY